MQRPHTNTHHITPHHRHIQTYTPQTTHTIHISHIYTYHIYIYITHTHIYHTHTPHTYYTTYTSIQTIPCIYTSTHHTTYIHIYTTGHTYKPQTTYTPHTHTPHYTIPHIHTTNHTPHTYRHHTYITCTYVYHTHTHTTIHTTHIHHTPHTHHLCTGALFCSPVQQGFRGIWGSDEARMVGLTGGLVPSGEMQGSAFQKDMLLHWLAQSPHVKCSHLTP